MLDNLILRSPREYLEFFAEQKVGISNILLALDLLLALYGLMFIYTTDEDIKSDESAVKLAGNNAAINLLNALKKVFRETKGFLEVSFSLISAFYENITNKSPNL